MKESPYTRGSKNGFVSLVQRVKIDVFLRWCFGVGVAEVSMTLGLAERSLVDRRGAGLPFN